MKKLLNILFFMAIASLSFAQASLELKDVTKVSEQLNSTAEESLPIISPDGRLYFVRTLFADNVGGNNSGQDIWYVEREESEWAFPTNELNRLNTKFNNAVIGVADSGRTLYLNGSYSSKPEYQTGVSVTYYQNGDWTRPKNLRIKGYNPSSPYMSYYVNGDIGVMLLSFTTRSDPDNEDLYVSFLNKGRVWSKPESLGPFINTEEAEFSPFIESDGKTLFFSSEGHEGLGGADVFSAYRLDDTWQNWSTVTNLGAPVNSEGFDAYYSRSGKEAFFASNRESTFADIYRAEYEVVVKTPTEENTMADGMTKENMFALKGFLDIKNPDRVGMVRVMDQSGNIVQRVKPNTDGSFLIKGLDQYNKYSLDLDGQEKEIEDLEIFFVNQDGSRVYLNEGIIDGSFPFETLDKDIRAVLMAEVSEDSELEITNFTFDGEGEIPAGSTVHLLDDVGREQETAVVNRQGQFELATIQSGPIYKIELEEGTLDVNSKVYLVNGDERYEVSGTILKGALFRKINNQLRLIDPDSEEGRYAYNKLNGQQSDIDGMVTRDGELTADGQYDYNKLSGEEGDIDGMNTGDGELTADGQYAYNKLTGEEGDIDGMSANDADLDASTFGFEYGELPPEGTKVLLTDENGNVIDEAYTDENGLFQFKKLDPDKKYSMTLDKTGDVSRDLSMYLVDDDGLHVPLAKGVAQGEAFDGEVINADAPTAEEDQFSFNYSALPPAGSKVYLTDESDVVIDSSYVDADGNFKFKKLNPDRLYKMRLSEEVDNSAGIQYAIIDKSGRYKKLASEEYEGDEISANDASLSTDYDKFSFDYNNLPAEGTVVYLMDEDGSIADSSFVDGNGNFRFQRLDPSKTYGFMLSDEDFDMDAANLYKMDNGERRILKKLPSSFTLEGLEHLQVADSELDISKFQLELADEDIPDSAQAYLYDSETNEIVETAEIDSDGNFSFKKLDSDRKYSIKFDKEIDETNARFFAFEEQDVELDIASVISKPTKPKPEPAPPTPVKTKPEPVVAKEPTKPKEEKLSKMDSEWVIYFEFNSFLMNEEQIDYLVTEVISQLKDDEKLTISIDGHTDNIGSEEVNKRMAHLRISNVVYHLEIRGIDESRVSLKTSYGESKPVASNDTEEGRAKNRRVEIHITK